MYDDEELLETGSDRSALATRLATLARRPVYRIAGVLVALAVVAALIVVATADADRSRHPAAAPPTTHRSAPATAAVGSPSAGDNTYVDVEYLLDVPAEDMQAAVATCKQICVASTLNDSALTQAVAQFPGLHPLAGGTVRRRDGTLVLRTVEGESGIGHTAALAHLVVRPQSGTAGAHPYVRTTPGDGYRTITVTDTHDGCRFTATLVVRTGEAPEDAALQWAHSTPLRCR